MAGGGSFLSHLFFQKEWMFLKVLFVLASVVAHTHAQNGQDKQNGDCEDYDHCYQNSSD